MIDIEVEILLLLVETFKAFSTDLNRRKKLQQKL